MSFLPIAKARVFNISIWVAIWSFLKLFAHGLAIFDLLWVYTLKVLCQSCCKKICAKLKYFMKFLKMFKLLLKTLCVNLPFFIFLWIQIFFNCGYGQIWPLKFFYVPGNPEQKQFLEQMIVCSIFHFLIPLITLWISCFCMLY